MMIMKIPLYTTLSTDAEAPMIASFVVRGMTNTVSFDAHISDSGMGIREIRYI